MARSKSRDLCFECGHERMEHGRESGCWDENMSIGPSDNMDVDIEPCDCGHFVEDPTDA